VSFPKKRFTEKAPRVQSAPAGEGGATADSATVSESLAGHRVAKKSKTTVKNRLRIVLKSVSDARVFINFDHKMSTRILQVCIKYSTYVTYFVTSSAAVFKAVMRAKINVYDKIMIDKTEKKRKHGNQRNFLHKFLPKRWFSNEINSLIRRADSRGSDDIIYTPPHFWRG